jgi:hypothetical protein
MSTNGASTDVGTGAFDVGDFTNLLLDINPTYTVGGYPETWTQFTVNISRTPPGTSMRLAFHYFVENGGPNGTRSDYIGIDRAVYVMPCATPTPTATPPATTTRTGNAYAYTRTEWEIQSDTETTSNGGASSDALVLFSIEAATSRHKHRSSHH